MTKYGILERGMELSDVADYAAGTALTDPEQVFMLRVARDEVGAEVDSRFLRRHSAVEGNLFRLTKGPKGSRRYVERPPLTVGRIVRGMKRRLARF